MVAAAVEIGAAPLAQVNALLLWKRAGAAAAGRHSSVPRRAQKLQVPWKGFGVPQSSGGAHGHGTAQRRRHSCAERAWAGAELSAGAAAGQGSCLPESQGHPQPRRGGLAKLSLARAAQGHRDGARSLQDNPRTGLRQPQRAGGRGTALPDPQRSSSPQHVRPPVWERTDPAPSPVITWKAVKCT